MKEKFNFFIIVFNIKNVLLDEPITMLNNGMMEIRSISRVLANTLYCICEINISFNFNFKAVCLNSCLGWNKLWHWLVFLN